MDSSGRSQFSDVCNKPFIRTAGKGLVLEAFKLDLLEGFSLTRTPLVRAKASTRGSRLRVCRAIQAFCVSAITSRETEPKFLQQACDFRIEGIVSKLANSLYESTRSHSWQKIKC